MVALSVGIVLFFLSLPAWSELLISFAFLFVAVPLRRAFIDETYLHHEEER